MDLRLQTDPVQLVADPSSAGGDLRFAGWIGRDAGKSEKSEQFFDASRVHFAAA
jgi:hypothetical protein